jgi:hypothetical protein
VPSYRPSRRPYITNYLYANCIVWFGDATVVIMQEKKLVAEIKKTAKTGNEVSLKLWEICSSVVPYFLHPMF